MIMCSCNFLEVCRDVTKTARKIPQSDYLPQGNYKIFDQGKQYIAGYADDSEGIVSDYPYIVFGDHTRIMKFVTEPCFIGADGVKLLKVYNEDFIPQYVFYALLAQPIENQGYSRHFKYLKEKSIPCYSLEKQNAIVSELDKIQSALDNKKEQLKKLDELIQSKFYEMFGDPVINEKGWNVDTLNNACEAIIAGGDKPKDFSLLKTDEYLYPIFANGEDDKGLLGYSKTYRIDKNAVTLGSRGASIGNTRICEAKFTPVVRLITLIPKDEVLDLIYLYYSVKQLNFHITGAGQAQLTIPNVKCNSIALPPLPLQQAFAAYVEKVEQAKTIVNQEIAHLQELLNSRMDYYFKK